MKAILQALILTTLLLGIASRGLWAQANSTPDVLHIQYSVTTSTLNFPQYFHLFKVLNGEKSPLQASALTGTLTLTNDSPNFSEVLWLLAYWKDKCPSEQYNFQNAIFIWSDILKNPSQSASQFPVDLHFPQPLPLTGCVALVFAGGPLVAGTVTMSADLNLDYTPSTPSPDTVIDFSGEYCFGQIGCENYTNDDTQAFGVPITLPAGHLLELFGNISDSTFDDTGNFGPLPTGRAWGATNDFYLLPGGCGQFGANLNTQGFPNPQPLSTLYSWLPSDAVHLESVPLDYQIPFGQTGIATLQQKVERVFPVPVAINAGDCMVVIYGRRGNGATDNETQVHALVAP